MLNNMPSKTLDITGRDTLLITKIMKSSGKAFPRRVPMKQNSMRIERKRVTDQIIDQMISMITDGKFKPGDKLPPEPALMEQFGVGRSSLREAIGALSLIGMLTVRPGYGTHVSASLGESASKPLRWGMFMGWREKLHE